MQDSWIKYLLALAIAGSLTFFIYYLSTRLPGTVQSDQSSASLKDLGEQLPEFDFYRFLPDSEELIQEPGSSANETGKLPADPVGLIFQVGAYRDEREANRRRAELILLNLPARIEQTYIDRQEWYRLRIGPVGEDEFKRVRQRLRQNDIDYFLSRPKSP